MAATVFSVFVISIIGAGLATLLVLADRYVTNYGECEVKINEEEGFQVQGGGSVLETLTQQKIFIPSACGGRGSCGYCKVKVLDGAGPLLPTEEPYLDDEERNEGIRLSCQVKIRNDVHIQMPEELLAIQEYQCVCVDIRDLTYDIKQFRFELKEPDRMSFVPGHYVQFFTPAYEGSEEEVYRAYSISSDPAEEGIIELIVRLVPNGICTTYMFEHLKVGDLVRINGPYGDFRLSDTDAPIVFVAGGSGMAPIKSMLHHMVNTGNTRRATYFFGVNTLKDLFYAEEMKAFEGKLPDFKFFPVLAMPESGNGWNGETGLVTEALDRTLNSAGPYEAYLCGSPGMIDATIDVLKKHGMPLEHIYYDKFS
jgi:Na+-transporting NADH:ubiquinone oxidoreductase subunit F